MKIYRIARILILLAIPRLTLAQPAPNFKLSDQPSFTSPDGMLTVEPYIQQPLGDSAHFEFWVFDKSRKHACQLNRGETGDSSVYPAGFRFSPNSEWLVRMQKTDAGTSTLFLYHREGLRFVPATARALGDLAWDYFDTLPDSQIATGNLSPETDLIAGMENNYTSLGEHWPDSRYIVIGLSSGESGTTPVGPWHCVYDTQTGHFSVPPDFAKFNREHKPAPQNSK
jgi:hypothetical protein